MSNVEGSKYFEQVEEWSVPLDESGKCTARDVSDLLRVAGEHAKVVDPKHADYDDAFYVQADGDRLVVQFRTRVEKNAAVLT